MYNLTSQNNLTPQNYILAGLVAFALIVTATPAVAKDHHNSKHKTYYSHHGSDKHGHNKHDYKHKRVYQSHGQKYHKKGHDRGRHDTHYRRHYSHNHNYNNYTDNYDHNHRRHYYKHERHHYKHERHYKYRHRSHRHSDYVDDYFAILGGTILVNELLYHSHERR